jgi:TldD protein
MTIAWTRRRWLQRHAITLAAALVRRPAAGARSGRPSVASPGGTIDRATRMALQAAPLEPGPWQALAQQAVDAACTAGARYAEARLTRVVVHEMGVVSVDNRGGRFHRAEERVGIGVRALVDGYWGFSASAVNAVDEAERLARDAVGQAHTNANGLPWTVDLGHYPVATGTWATPVRIDPFTIPIEEKQDFMMYWFQCANNLGLNFDQNGFTSWVQFVRQERVVATSEGALFTQTLYESGGEFHIVLPGGPPVIQDVQGIALAGAGWERFLDAKIPDQYPRIKEELQQNAAIPRKPATVGKYTVVCDGATMAALVEATLGVATQLDRALGYEANASGTSFLDDPLAMVGQRQVASPLVTLTANRSAPAELATVKWDDEGVEPAPFTLVKDGVLVDFQTTREQAAWLAPYYTKANRPVASHGCAAAEDAHVTPMQHMPNLVLKSSPSAIRLDDLVADVTEGILVEGGKVFEMDFQARTGLLLSGSGSMRQIRNGRLGAVLTGGAVLFDAPSLWKHVLAVGGPSTQQVGGYSSFYYSNDDLVQMIPGKFGKGEPPQRTSHSVRAVAATLPNQPLIDPSRKT